ncbi:MAG: hypothetical protein ACTSP4_16755 [Candidatus Hodarchaeales archaeon]
MKAYLTLITGQEELLNKVDGIHDVLQELKELDKLGKLDKLDKLEKLEFLDKLDNPRVISTIERLATVLGFVANQNNDAPEEIVRGLITNTLAGKQGAKEVYQEFLEEGVIPTSVDRTVREYSYLNEVRQEEVARFNEILTRFMKTGKIVSHEIEVYLEVAELFEISEFEKELDFFLSKLLTDEKLRSQFGIISLTNILDRSGRLRKLSKRQKKKWIELLELELADTKDNDARKLEIIYFLHKLGHKLPKRIIQKTFDSVKKSEYAQELKGEVSFSKRLIRFFKREKIRSKYEISASINRLRKLISKLEQRKFKRTTKLLLQQLDIINREINLLIIDFEKARELGKRININDLEFLLISLNEIIQLPAIKELRADSRLKLYKLLDSSLYLQDQISIHNTINLLETGGAKINSVFSDQLKNYRKSNAQELKELLARIQITELITDEDIAKRISDELPTPKRRKRVRTTLKQKN